MAGIRIVRPRVRILERLRTRNSEAQTSDGSGANGGLEGGQGGGGSHVNTTGNAAGYDLAVGVGSSNEAGGGGVVGSRIRRMTRVQAGGGGGGADVFRCECWRWWWWWP